jgi:hypothetical protein
VPVKAKGYGDWYQLGGFILEVKGSFKRYHNNFLPIHKKMEELSNGGSTDTEQLRTELNICSLQKVKVIAEEYYFVEQFENALADELKTPSPDVLKSIYRRMGGKRFDEKVETKLNELFNSFSLQGAVDKLRESESRNAKLGIITTQEELTAFSVIRTILATSGKVKAAMLDRIGYRDYKGHFSILVDDSQTKSICILSLSGKKALKIDAITKDLEDPIEVSLSKYKKEIIDSALRYL